MKRTILTIILSLVFISISPAQENSESEQPSEEIILKFFTYAQEGLECLYANEELIRLMDTYKSFNMLFQVDEPSRINDVSIRLNSNIELFEQFLWSTIGYLDSIPAITEEQLTEFITENRNETYEKLYYRRDVKDPKQIQDQLVETFEYVRWCRNWIKEGLGETAVN